MPDSLAGLIIATDRHKPTVLASLGNPYLLQQVPDFAGTYLNAWSDIGSTERAVAAALAGGAAISGTLPISIGDQYVRGFGIPLAAGYVGDGTNGRPPIPLDSIERYLQGQVTAGAFPGAVLYVGHRGAIAYHTTVGRYGIDDARPVNDSTIYDLASLTKVIGLTTASMLLVADGSLDLDRPVVDYVPEFGQHGKETVTVRQLLLHTSGLPPWRPLYQETQGPTEAVDSVMATELDTVPGARYAYSDLGAITLGKIVEAASDTNLGAFLESRVFGPLGMTRTRFNPPASWTDQIAPTEMDPWRGHIVRGEVHDENAARLGGISGHAGLFSNGPDIIRFGLWLLDAYHGRLQPEAAVYLPEEVVRTFTARQNDPDGSTRALG